MVSIRLSRVGKSKQPEYRVVVMDKRKDPWGTSLDIVGYYNPRANPKKVQFNAERIKYWISKGAEASPTVWNLLVDAKIVEGAKHRAHPTGANKAADAKAAAPAS